MACEEEEEEDAAFTFELDELSDDNATPQAAKSEQSTPPRTGARGKAKGKAKAVAGAQPSSGRKNKKWCIACAKFLPASQFSAHCPYCTADEARIKRLRRLAKSQNKQEWLANLLKSPDRLPRMLKYYADRCPQKPDGAYPPLDITVYGEYEKALTYSDSFQDGVMMHKDRAVKHWQSEEGGGFSYPEAVEMWNDSVKRVREEKIPGDEDGPPKSRERCWVKTDKHVQVGSRYEKGKNLSREEKPKKRMTEADIIKRRSLLVVDHDDVAGQDVGDDSMMVGVKLGTSAAGFASDNAFVGSLTALEEHAEQEEMADKARQDAEQALAAAEEGDEAGAEVACKNDDGDGSCGGPRQKKKSRAQWWNRDAAISKAKSEWEAWITDKKHELEAARAKMDKSMKSDFVNAPSVKPWKSTCNQCLRALGLVLSEESDAEAKMREYIKSFEMCDEKLPVGAGAAPGAMSSASSSGGRMAIGAAPPCARYAALVPLRELRDKIQLIDFAEDMDALKGITKELRDHKAPLADLMSNFCKRLADLNRALLVASKTGKSISQAAAAAQQAASRSSAQEGGPPMTLPQLFEVAAGGGKALEVHKAAELPSVLVGETDFFEQPVLVVSLNDVESVTKVGGAFLKGVLGAKADFMNDKKVNTSKGGSGRAQQTPRAVAAQEGIHTLFHRYFAHLDAVVKTSVFFSSCLAAHDAGLQPLVDAMQASLFGIEKGSSHFGVERHLLGSIRLAMSGTRQIVCARFADVYIFMQEEAVPLGSVGKSKDDTEVHGYDIDAVGKFFRYMTSENMHKFTAKHPVFTGTQAALDCLFLPPGFVYAESILQNDHMFGLKLGYITAAKKCADFFMDNSARYGGTSKSVAVMQAASRCYDLIAMVETVPASIGAGVGPLAAGSTDAPALGDVKNKEVQPEKGQHTGNKELAKQEEGKQAHELQSKLDEAPAAPKPPASLAAASSQAKNAGAVPRAAGAGANKRSADVGGGKRNVACDIAGFDALVRVGRRPGASEVEVPVGPAGPEEGRR